MTIKLLNLWITISHKLNLCVSVCGQTSIEATNLLCHFKWVWSGMTGHAHSFVR